MALRRPLYLMGIGLSIAAVAFSYALQNDIKPLAVSISVSRTPLSSPFYIAEHQGFFKQAEVDVTLVDVIGGHLSFNAMAKGNSDLATCSDSVIMFNSFKSSDFSVLTTFVQSDNDIKIIGKRKRGNLTAAALEHQKIAVAKGSASEFFAQTYLMIEGIDPASVTTINIAPEHMLQELQQEQVAAISVWEPFAFKAMEQLQDDALIYPSKGLYNLTFNLVAKRSYIQQNPERIRRVLQALERAIQFITENPATSKAIIKNKLSLDDAFIDWIWPDYLFKLSLNQTLLSTLESEARWAIENGLVEPQEVPDYRQYIDSAPLVALEPWASTL